MDSIGVGLVGAGFLAETRARTWRRVPGARIVALTSRTGARAEDLARRHGLPAPLPDVDALLARPDVHLVDLCVPNLCHRPLTERAAAAGKHVLCTKPLAAYHGQDLPPGADDAAVSGRDPRTMRAVAVGDALAMQRAAESAGVRLFYGENWVSAPAVRRAAELVRASGGAVLEMRGWECHKGSHSPYSKRWRDAGGGALLRLGAHPVGVMLHLKRVEGLARAGRPVRPVTVTAEVADLSRVAGLTPANTRVAGGWVDVESWGCVVIGFEDGSRGVAYGSDNVLGGMASRLEVYGSNLRLCCNLSPNDLLQAYAPEDAVLAGEYVMEKADGGAGWSTPMPDEDWTAGHVGMCASIAAALRGGEETPADGALGVETTRVIYSAYVSAREGRRVAVDDQEPSSPDA